MDDKLHLVLPFAPSVNHYWLSRGKTRFLSPRAKKFRHDVRMLAYEFVLLNSKKYPLINRLSLEIHVYPPDRRVRDLDNLAKGTLDSLTHAGIYVDDSQIDKLSIIRCEIDKPLGRLEIFISEM